MGNQGRGELGQLPVDFLRRPDGTLRIVAMGDRRAENRHYRITDMLVDSPAKAPDDFVHDREIALQQRVHLLRIDLGRQCGKAREIGEQHSHLTPGIEHRGGRLG